MRTNHSHHPADTTDLVASALTRYTPVIASRRIGTGQPLLLCLRLRGVMDVWDLAVLKALAETFPVITFDARGLDPWTGTPSDDRAALARDATELADARGLDNVCMARDPERTSHPILIGTVPPGAQPSQAEPICLPTALQPHVTREDAYGLCCESESACRGAAGTTSYARSAARTGHGSPEILEETSLRLVQASHDDQAVFPDHASSADVLASTAIPLLVLSGDHAIVFPGENGYALHRTWTSLHIMTFPQAGHRPPQTCPEVCADVLARCVRNVREGTTTMAGTDHARVMALQV